MRHVAAAAMRPFFALGLLPFVCSALPLSWLIASVAFATSCVSLAFFSLFAVALQAVQAYLSHQFHVGRHFFFLFVYIQVNRRPVRPDARLWH